MEQSEIFFEEGAEDDEDMSTKLQYDIMVNAADLTTEDLHKKMAEGVIEIPGFQRDYVWNIRQASRLIDSFMMGLPVPPIFLYLQQNEKYLLIDGGQRLRTIQYFYDGHFDPVNGTTNARRFKLEGLNPKNPLAGLAFEDFDDTDRQRFKNQVLRAIIIRQLKPDDHTSIYHIFERLNTGGVALKDQEVRNCVYAGGFNDFLNKLNDYGNWRLFLGRDKHLQRKKDVELILRYMALLHTSDSYMRPMKDYLSSYMDKNRNPPDSFLDAEERRFQRICDTLVGALGERPLHKEGLFSAAVFDAVFVAMGRHDGKVPEDLSERIEKLRNDEEFRSSTATGTSESAKVHARINLAEKYLFDD